jgi:hypothetical protein
LVTGAPFVLVGLKLLEKNVGDKWRAKYFRRLPSKDEKTLAIRHCSAKKIIDIGG